MSTTPRHPPVTAPGPAMGAPHAARKAQTAGAHAPWGHRVAGLVFALAAIAVVAGQGLVARATDLFPDALPPHPYLVPSHALLLYCGVPLVVLAAVAVTLAPGTFLVLAMGRVRSVAELVLKAFVVSWFVHVTTFTLLQIATPGPTPRWALLAAFIGAGAAAWLVLASRRRASDGGAAPLNEDRAFLVTAAILVVVVVCCLLPVLLWQDLNPDAMEAFTTGRSLVDRLIPRLPTGRATGLGLGMVATAYPIRWFMVLFGPVDAAARLPLMLYLPVVMAGVVATAEIGSPRRLSAAEKAAVAAAVGLFAAVLAFNDTYHVYSADIASPSSIDVAAVALMLGMVYALYANQRLWFIAFTAVAYLTRPTALMLLGLLAIAVTVAGGEGRRRRLLTLALGLGTCAAVMLTFEGVFAALAHVRFAENSERIAARLRFLRFDDVRRFLFILIPTGLLPALALPLYRRQDAMGRTLILVTVGYFAFFYVVAFYVLHHFAPVMVLPVVVYWRLLLRRPAGRIVPAVTIAAIAGCLLLSLPRDFAINRTSREIGRQTLYAIGNPDGSYSEWRRAFVGSFAMDTLFPPYWKDRDPAHERQGSPWAQIHYSVRPAGPSVTPSAAINYVVQPVDAPAPAGFTRVAATRVAATYVRDLGRWHRDRYGHFDTHFRSPIYDIPRDNTLPIWGVPTHSYQIDVRAVLERLLPRGWVPGKSYWPTDTR